MLSSELSFALSLAVVFPLLVGLLRWRVTTRGYTPLLVLFALGFITELIMRYLLMEKIKWEPANNLYILAECILIPLQFATWGYMRTRRKILYIVPALLAAGWIIRHLWPGQITHLDPYFRMVYSLVIVLLSINTINYLVIHEENRLIRHPVFIICTAFIIFFSYQLVYEGIYSLINDLRTIDTAKLNTAFSLINFACNLLYGLAFLLIPSRSIRDWLNVKK